MKIKISWNTISFKLVFGFFIITIPLIVFLIYNNYYAMDVVRDKVAESNKKMVTLYMGTIDNTLSNVERNIFNFATLDKDVERLEYFLSEEDYALAKLSAQRKLKDNILMFDTIDSLFLYAYHSEELIEAFKLSGVSYSERENVRSYIHSVIMEDSWQVNEEGWHLKQINGEYYLFRFIKTSGTVVGSWLNLEKLLTPLYLMDLGNVGNSFFVTDDGESVGAPPNLVEDNQIDFTGSLETHYLSGKQDKFLIVGQKSSIANFSLVAVIPDEKITENFLQLEKLVVFIAVGSLIMLPICLFLLNKTVLSPLRQIVLEMKRIGKGNLDVRIKQGSTSEEFQLVNDTFNRMMDQIKELKINVYEERLLKQKAELQYLHYQINPHFFMNTLNIIFNLAQVKKYDLVQEMTLCLVRYFRYMLKSNVDFVALKDEIEHTKNYLRIQELRFPKSLSYEVQVDEQVLHASLPPLVLQTFVENTIKYAVTLDNPVHLSIQVKLEISEKEDKLRIIIQDTGHGFPEAVLAEVCAGNRIVDEQGEHIGIWNVQKRLQLLYPSGAFITFRNAIPHGAVVEMILPVA